MSAKYPARADTMITSEMRARIEAAAASPTARAEGMGLSDVMREALAVGLPRVEARLRRQAPTIDFVPPDVAAA